jgi:tRNA modification GTPase
MDQDTIVALSTPPGRGGIGVVRLSGAEAREIARPLLDEAVVTFFGAPHSYTTEDVIEIATHSSPVVLEQLVRAAVAGGARLAGPGEFTQRAFLAGRLDLTQAEAVHDLIAAQTLAQARTAAAQLGGSIAQAVSPVKAELLQLIAALEAGVDFAEDDLDLLGEDEILGRIATLEAALEPLGRSFAYGRIIRDGLTLAIVGAPNAGKSSLFNRLLERERAIVTAMPGTTRDTVTERMSLDGIPVELVDTAGLREVAATPDTEAERAGMTRSRQSAATADLVLHIVDSSTLELGFRGEACLNAEDEALRAELVGRPYLLVLNKSDLRPGMGEGTDSLYTSALTGAGIDRLRHAIRGAIASQPEGDSAVVTNLRQQEAILGAQASLGRAWSAAKAGVPHEFLLLDLQEALARLDELTGATAAGEVLNLIFASFCIGK